MTTVEEIHQHIIHLLREEHYSLKGDFKSAAYSNGYWCGRTSDYNCPDRYRGSKPWFMGYKDGLGDRDGK